MRRAWALVVLASTFGCGHRVVVDEVTFTTDAGSLGDSDSSKKPIPATRTTPCPADDQPSERCDAGPTCVHGVGIDTYETTSIMRNLAGGAQGQRVFVRRSGMLEDIALGVWGGAVKVTVERECGGQAFVLRTGQASASQVPAYDGIRSRMVLTTISFDPPIPVFRGDVLNVYVDAPVALVRRFDPDPFGEMFANDAPSDWDLALIIALR